MMKIRHLPVGTKLMWDAPAFDNAHPEKRITYPATVTERHYNKSLVKIRTGNQFSWMGPDEKYLRWPTESELNTLTWPLAE